MLPSEHAWFRGVLRSLAASESLEVMVMVGAEEMMAAC